MVKTHFSLALRQWFSFPSYLLRYLGYFMLLNMRLHICWRTLESLSLVGGVMVVLEMESELDFT